MRVGVRRHSSVIDRWLFALKLPSWPKLLVPTLLGQTIALASVAAVDYRTIGLGFAFTIFDIAFIVLMNDWGDREIDGLKRRLFPHGGGRKTIPDRVLGERSVFIAGVIAGLAAIVTAVIGASVLDRPALGAAGLGCILLFVVYTLPPIKLNYRGGGEFVEAFGVGIALPCFHVYLVSGSLDSSWLGYLAGFTFMSLASAVASGLSDEVSDRLGGKRTIASMFGNYAARLTVLGTMILGVAAWSLSILLGVEPVWLGVAPALVLANGLYAIYRAGPDAETNAFAAQARFKQHLHRAIWYGTTSLCLSLVAYRTFG